MRLVRVLVVEDERKLAQVLSSALQAEHYDVVVAATGEDGFYRANAELFDLVVLDLMLPGRSGLEILQTLRQRHIETPVLILTARDGVEDRVLGLDLGADDYLVKPFALPELLARIRALLRRGRPSDVAAPEGRRSGAGPGRAARRPRRPADRSDRPRVRAARIPAAASGPSRVARNAGARCLEGAAPRDAARQRHRRADGAASAQEVDLRRRRPPDPHRSRCRVRGARGRAVSRWWSTARRSASG